MILFFFKKNSFLLLILFCQIVMVFSIDKNKNENPERDISVKNIDTLLIKYFQQIKQIFNSPISEINIYQLSIIIKSIFTTIDIPLQLITLKNENKKNFLDNICLLFDSKYDKNSLLTLEEMLLLNINKMFKEKTELNNSLWKITEFLIIKLSYNKKEIIETLLKNTINELYKKNIILPISLELIEKMIELNIRLSSIIEDSSLRIAIEKTIINKYKKNIDSTRLNDAKNKKSDYYLIGYHFLNTDDTYSLFIIGANGWNEITIKALLKNIKTKENKNKIIVIAPFFESIKEKNNSINLESDITSLLIMQQPEISFYIPLKISTKEIEKLDSLVSASAVFLGKFNSRIHVSFSGFNITYRPIEESHPKYLNLFYEKANYFDFNEPQLFTQSMPYTTNPPVFLDILEKYINNQAIEGDTDLFKNILMKSIFINGYINQDPLLLNYKVNKEGLQIPILKLNDLKIDMGCSIFITLNQKDLESSINLFPNSPFLYIQKNGFASILYNKTNGIFPEIIVT